MHHRKSKGSAALDIQIPVLKFLLRHDEFLFMNGLVPDLQAI